MSKKKHRKVSTSALAALYQQAVGCFQGGRLEEAEDLLRKLLKGNPDLADASFLLGLVAFQRTEYDAAIDLIQRAIKIDPGQPMFHYNLGVVMGAAGYLKKALSAYERATRLEPTLAEAHCNMGAALFDLGRLDEAVAACNAAIQLRPRHAKAHTNLGNALRKLGRTAEALVAYERAIQLDPNNAASVCYNKGMVLSELGRPGEAMLAYENAVELDPGLAEAHCNLGAVLVGLGCPRQAEASYKRAIELRPDYTKAYSSLLFSLNYRDDLSVEAIFDAHRQWRCKHDGPLASIRGGNGDRGANSRLKIGYVSPDFFTHSVAYFFEPLLDAHDRELVDIYCYSNVQNPDATTERLQRKASHWISIVDMTDEEVAHRIRQDGIDILVDLAGHTSGNRLPVFAFKPAPVQVAWLGYSNTTGMQAMDYRFTDSLADPVGDVEHLYTETLVRLDHGFLCYQPPANAPDVTQLPCSTGAVVTFGSFNSIAKVNAGVVDLWARILKAVPGSQLLLKDKAFADEPTGNRYREMFVAQGIAGDRIRLYGKLPRTVDHLKLYGQVDIALDPFPYNGTTTTCEALWMGVPVVALDGDRHAARVGKSILARIGRNDWIAADLSSYVDIALRLASDKAGLADIRRDLRGRVRASPLCDAEAFARDVENAYSQIWNNYLNS